MTDFHFWVNYPFNSPELWKSKHWAITVTSWLIYGVSLQLIYMSWELHMIVRARAVRRLSPNMCLRQRDMNCSRPLRGAHSQVWTPAHTDTPFVSSSCLYLCSDNNKLINVCTFSFVQHNNKEMFQSDQNLVLFSVSQSEERKVKVTGCLGVRKIICTVINRRMRGWYTVIYAPL